MFVSLRAETGKLDCFMEIQLESVCGTCDTQNSLRAGARVTFCVPVHSAARVGFGYEWYSNSSVRHKFVVIIKQPDVAEDVSVHGMRVGLEEL